MFRGVLFVAVCFLSLLNCPDFCSAAETRSIVDASGRQVIVPEKVDRVICSGPGALRLLTYLQGADRVVGVDSAETKSRKLDARPYAMAHPEFKNMSVFGEFRGMDDPEKILMLEPQPQVIFKTYATMGYDPDELQEKTGVPVVVLNYGDLGRKREQLFQALTIMGNVLGKAERAEGVKTFFAECISDLEKRTASITETEQKSVYIGGVSYKGPHGYQSTEPAYPPFLFINANNLAAADCEKPISHADVAKEKIVEWNPEYLFLDLSTLRLGEAGGLYELQHDAAYRELQAVKSGLVYGLLPYNWYTSNLGSVIVNAYVAGKILYPSKFEDINVKEMSGSVYQFLVGKDVFDELNESFGSYTGQALPVQ
ncbi:MAG: iron ABC transporter substrate-binding protein [Desulfovibrio sp.]